ncbi:MAG: uroporphyrinogen-III synthase [Verrucomicrobiota bacterium]
MLDEAIAYETVPETKDPTGAVARFQKEGADLITFTSASTVECFLDLGLDLTDETAIASIGPITTQAVRENELEPDVEAEKSTIPSLIDAITQYFAERG